MKGHWQSICRLYVYSHRSDSRTDVVVVPNCKGLTRRGRRRRPRTLDPLLHHAGIHLRSERPSRLQIPRRSFSSVTFGAMGANLRGKSGGERKWMRG